MVDLEALTDRLRALEGYRDLLRDHARVPRSDFCSDADTHDLAERRLHLAIECMIDIANHVVAEEGLRPAPTYRDAFLVLADHGVLSRALAQRLTGWAGLRNLLVHLYLGIDHARVHDVITGELRDLDAFAAEMRQWIAGQGA